MLENEKKSRRESDQRHKREKRKERENRRREKEETQIGRQRILDKITKILEVLTVYAFLVSLFFCYQKICIKMNLFESGVLPFHHDLHHPHLPSC